MQCFELRFELRIGRCVHTVCVYVLVYMLCEQGGFVGGTGAVKLQGKMLMLTQALKLKMKTSGIFVKSYL